MNHIFATCQKPDHRAKDCDLTPDDSSYKLPYRPREKTNTGKYVRFPGHLLSGKHTGNPKKDFRFWKSGCKSHISCGDC